METQGRAHILVEAPKLGIEMSKVPMTAGQEAKILRGKYIAPWPGLRYGY